MIKVVKFINTENSSASEKDGYLECKCTKNKLLTDYGNGCAFQINVNMFFLSLVTKLSDEVMRSRELDSYERSKESENSAANSCNRIIYR